MGYYLVTCDILGRICLPDFDKARASLFCHRGNWVSDRHLGKLVSCEIGCL